MESSLCEDDSESSSGSSLLFCSLVEAVCVTDEASWWKAAGFVWPGVEGVQPVDMEEILELNPNPNPKGEGA